MTSSTRQARPRPADVRAIAAASLALVVAALPVFLLGAVSFAVRADLGFSETGLGLAITISFLVAAVAATRTGRLVDRLGARRALLLGSAISAVALLLIATATGWPQLAAGMALAGLGIATSEPGIATSLSRLVPPGRQGLAFGVKEAAIPGATLLAGIAVPAIALTVGWRWAFAGGLLLVPALWVALPSALRTLRPASPRVAEAPGSADTGTGNGGSTGTDAGTRRGLVVVAVGAGLGIAPVTAMGTFLVETTVAVGARPGVAGGLLVLGSVAGITGRVLVGWWSDRSGRPPLTTMVAMVTAGVLAMGLLAGSGALAGPAAMVCLVLGTLLGFGVGWAWTGLLFLSAVRAAPAAPGMATGIALSGLSVGGALGPLGFGLLVEATSYPTAWTLGAATMLTGAATLAVGRRLLPEPA